MAGSISAEHRGEASGRDRPSSGSSASSSADGPMPGLGWVSVALGAAALAAGLGSRRSTPALALTALAGVAAVGALRGVQLDRGKAEGTGRRVAPDEPEVERSITIGKTADELYKRWRDPKTLPQIVAGFASVRAVGEGRIRWTVEAPLGRTYEWDTETVEARPGEGVRWRSLPDAAVATEGTVRFRPAPAGRGTVTTLHVRFDPPGGALGDAAVGLLGATPLKVVADGILRRFKSLVESGEIPTTERQPAARADTR
jgi:uncharacterized membrane protein